MTTPTSDAPDADVPTSHDTARSEVTAAILSVGSELLLGDLTDTNATWLSQRLRELGVTAVHHVAVRDDLTEFADALSWLSARADLVIVGGGLGPTADDVTREAIAAAAGVALEHRADLEAWLVERFASIGRTMAPENLRQARIPAGARVLEAVGTAPGFALTTTGAPTPTRVFALPGVPWELRELFERDVVPEIRELTGPRATLTRVVRVVGRGESDVAGVVEPLLDDDEVTLSFLARQQEVHVRLTVTANDLAVARTGSQPLVDRVVAALGSAVVGVDDQTLEAVVLDLLQATGTTVATAESATAGDIAARLGRVPGASPGLLGGVVVYAAAAKHDLLGVPQRLLDDHGAVSAEVTTVLATAVRARFGADWGIAVTGEAGPTPGEDLPVGTVFWALANPEGEVEVHGRRLPGDRSQVIGRLGSVALDLLRRRLLER